MTMTMMMMMMIDIKSIGLSCDKWYVCMCTVE